MCITRMLLQESNNVIFNPRRMRRRVTVVIFVCVSVCLSVPPLRASLLICMAQVRYQLALNDIL